MEMKRYRRKPETFEGMQYNEYNFDEVCVFIHRYCTKTEKHIEMGNPIIEAHRKNRDSLYIRKGDFIRLTPDGFDVMYKHEFLRYYEEDK